MYLKKRTRFNKLVRISDKNLEWLKNEKDCKTIAGYLDKIINQIKKDGQFIHKSGGANGKRQ